MKEMLRTSPERPRRSLVVINPAFTRLLAGQGLSVLGNVLFDTTIVLWIATVLLPGRSYAPAAVSGVLISVCLGTILVGPLAGVFVDRWDKRRTMLAADACQLALVTGLAVIVGLPRSVMPEAVALGLSYAVVFVATTVSQFFNPARFTLIGDLVSGDEARADAAGKLQATATAAGIVGPPLAAPMLFTLGAEWAMWIDAATFLVSFLSVRAIRVPVRDVQPTGVGEAATASPAEGVSGVWRELVTGFRFLFRSRILIAILTAVTVATFGTGALNALDVFFVTRNLHVDAHWYGTLGMAEGIGGLLGALAAGWFCRRFRDVRVFGVGLALVGALVVLYSRQNALWPAVIVLALAGLPLGAVNTSATPILLREVPRELLGRTMALVNPIQQVANMASALIAGWLMSGVLLDFRARVGPVQLGPIDTIFGVCGVLILVAGVAALAVLRTPRSVESTDERAAEYAV